ncbi:MAG: cytochrome C [Burkholderiales bacterium]|nr:cytochrome C [Burkholderiales bacterium]
MPGRLQRWILALSMAALPALALAQSVEGVLMPGEVIKGHAKWEQDCRKCHIPLDRSAQPRLCVDCHKKIAEDLRDHVRLHGRLKDSTCRRCHTDHKGRKAKITGLNKDTFDHDQTRFRLRGAHKKPKTKCEDCHKPTVKYRDTPQACQSCHRKDDNEKGHKGRLGPKCEECHTDVNWKETKFDHNKTRFKLELGHKDVKCKECHTGQLYPFKDKPRACVACHKKDDDDPAKKGHKGHFGSKCEKCHDAGKWKKSIFDHERDAKYELKGKHFDAKCEKCHTKPLYTVKLPSDCYACHRKDDDEKGHKGSLGQKCAKCHNEKNWKTSKFDHDKDTDYPLTGKHAKVKCDKCHKSGVTVVAGKPRVKLPTACYACHKKDDDDPLKKAHKGRFGEKCNSCHTTKEWKHIIFDHDKDTDYRLAGKHRKAKCESCHNIPGEVVAKGVPRVKLVTACNACHKKDDFEKGHKGTLGVRCESCHSENSWRVEKFDHTKSRFPLTGSHAIVECKKCHKTVDYRAAPRACNGCHERDDVHKRRLGIDCERCHNMRTWKSWDFDHTKTGFRLDGAHAKPECYACHKAPMQKRRDQSIVSGCVVCHIKKDVHRGTFGPRCERCHGIDAWLPALRLFR